MEMKLPMVVNKPILGTPTFNPGIRNSIFLTDEDFKLNIGMNFNDGQRIDLEDNNNIM